MIADERIRSNCVVTSSMATACVVNCAAESDPLSLELLERLIPLLLRESNAENFDQFHLSIQSLLALTGDDTGPPTTLGQRRLLLLQQGISPSCLSMEVEEAVERLEVLTARCTGLQAELTNEVENYDQHQYTGAVPLADTLRELLAARDTDLQQLKAEEDRIRILLDEVPCKSCYMRLYMFSLLSIRLFVFRCI
jgi:hypothetical protein